jgi:hypothetical protein
LSPSRCSERTSSVSLPISSVCAATRCALTSRSVLSSTRSVLISSRSRWFRVIDYEGTKVIIIIIISHYEIMVFIINLLLR